MYQYLLTNLKKILKINCTYYWFFRKYSCSLTLSAGVSDILQGPSSEHCVHNGQMVNTEYGPCNGSETTELSLSFFVLYIIMFKF